MCLSELIVTGRIELPRQVSSGRLAAVLLLFALWPAAIHAQELEPRAYANTPVDLNILAIGYAWSNGNVLLDPALPIEDLDAELNLLVLRYVHSFDFLGDNAKFKALLPWVAGDWQGSLDGQPDTRRDRGIGDAWLSFEWNFKGAPALDREAFISHQPGTVLGASVRVSVPVGDYDSDRLLNLGSNRWSVRAELAAARSFGNWTLELIGGVRGFTDNTDFVNRLTLEQEPLWAAKGSVVYSFDKPGMWLGGGIAYGKGGRTTVEGFRRDTEQKNWRFGMVFAYPINAKHGLGLSVISGVNDGAGSDFDTLSLSYRYVWGAGF